MSDRSAPKASRWATALVALAMVTTPLQAVASHNSFGQHIYVSEVDEVAEGTLDPDIEDGAFDIPFHDNLEDGGPPARQDPADQQGLRYDGAKCQTCAKLLPTPATVQQETGFGADDELCVTGTWTVADTGDSIADDTLGDPDDRGQENIQLDAGVHQFSDCDHFDTTGEPEQ